MVSDAYQNWNELICYKNKQTVDWSKNVEKKLYFMYNGTQHFLVIKEDLGCKDGKSHYVIIEFDNGIIKKERTDHLKSASFSKIYYEHEYRYKPGDQIDQLLIISCFRKKTKYWDQRAYICRCLNDGYEFEITENDLLRGCRCPVCSNRKIIPGINNFGTTHPWMVQYLLNKEDGDKYSYRSKHEILCKCPFCGRIKRMAVYELYQNGFRCNYCNDKISYPNKMITAVLIQLEDAGIIHNFEREYHAQWAGQYSYDTYFILNGKPYIVEMDGGFHYRYNTLSKTPAEVTQNTDKIKEQLAVDHGIKVLRVDCNYPTMLKRSSYIIANIKSTLSSIINLDIIDWKECEKFATSNLIKTIADLYNQGFSRIEICKKYPYLSNSTIGNYLHIATDNGFCNYESHYHESMVQSSTNK